MNFISRFKMSISCTKKSLNRLLSILENLISAISYVNNKNSDPYGVRENG